MNFPFTNEQFLSIFEQYNLSVWPTQIFLNLLGLAALVLAVWRVRFSSKIISCILAFLWLWIGAVYHYGFFSSINPAAYVFAGLNVLQGVVFLVFGVFNPRLSFKFRADLRGITGSLFLLYGMVIYPLLGLLLGHAYPKTPTFGLPCPTTIFTFGILLWTDSKIPKTVLVIPALWSVVGFMAALKLGIFEDTGLLAAGLVGLAMIILRDRNISKPETEVGQAT